MRIRSALPLLAAILLATPATAADRSAPRVGPCPVFPRTNPWNERVDRLPVAHNSATLIASVGLIAKVHPDFGSGTWDGGPIGIPYTTVGHHQRRVKVTFDYADESDKGPYPIPPHAPIEGGSTPRATAT